MYVECERFAATCTWSHENMKKIADECNAQICPQGKKWLNRLEGTFGCPKCIKNHSKTSRTSMAAHTALRVSSCSLGGKQIFVTRKLGNCGKSHLLVVIKNLSTWPVHAWDKENVPSCIIYLYILSIKPSHQYKHPKSHPKHMDSWNFNRPFPVRQDTYLLLASLNKPWTLVWHPGAAIITMHKTYHVHNLWKNIAHEYRILRWSHSYMYKDRWPIT